MSKRKKNRKQSKPIGAIFILMALVGSYLFFNFYSTGTDAGAVIDNIQMEGNHLISDEEILSIIGDIQLDTVNRSTVKMIQNTLKSNSFIKEACVKVSQPATLIIQIAEFEPEAILLNQKKYYLAADGMVYPFRFIDAYKEIPVISGLAPDQQKELQQTLKMLQILKERPALFHLVSEIYWNKNHPGLILTRDAIQVELPDNGWHEKIFLLDRFIQRNFSKIKEKKYKKINLNYSNKIICS